MLRLMPCLRFSCSCKYEVLNLCIMIWQQHFSPHLIRQEIKWLSQIFLLNSADLLIFYTVGENISISNQVHSVHSTGDLENCFEITSTKIETQEVHNKENKQKIVETRDEKYETREIWWLGEKYIRCVQWIIGQAQRESVYLDIELITLLSTESHVWSRIV